jgi:hypothetical protein
LKKNWFPTRQLVLVFYNRKSDGGHIGGGQNGALNAKFRDK